MSKMAASHLQSCMRILLSVSLISLVFSSDEGYTQGLQYKSHSHHIFQVSTLLPSASCKTSSTGGTRKSSLQVVHRHGSCSPQARAKPNTLNHTKILVGDQLRVDSIRSKFSRSSNKNTTRDGSLGGSDATLPSRLGTQFDSIEYVVTVGIGSPQSNLTLIFDTGSDLTWTQCEPCADCYHQVEPIFDPSHSSSYANVPCTSPVCTAFGSGCSGSTCNYEIGYGDGSSSFGDVVTDTLTLTSMDVIRNFQFGCGHLNVGSFDEVAGLLGLSRDNLSIVGQTASKYDRYFSYCLPSSSSSTGFLTFGNTSETPKSLTFTPIATIREDSEFYGISIEEIAVAGTKLQIPSTVFSRAEAVIDSGTVITYLPPTAYIAMRTAFRKEMASYKRAKEFEGLDTCYDLRNTTLVVVPKIRFTFRGGAVMDLDPSGILITVSDSQVCLAFIPNDEDTDLVIYGNTQQRTFEVIYDVAGGQLGFAPNGCP